MRKNARIDLKYGYLSELRSLCLSRTVKRLSVSCILCQHIFITFSKIGFSMNKYVRVLVVSSLILSSLAASTVQANWFSRGLEMLTGGDDENSEESASSISSLAETVLSNDKIVDGFKQALEIGSEKVSSQLGSQGGFSADNLIRIPLPESLQTAHSALDKIGLASLGDELELKLNQAAEAAAPEAKDVFINAIKSMTFDDIQAIYNGPNDSATQFFKSNMTQELTEKMSPIIDQSLSEVGAIAAYDNFIGKYDTIPFLPDLKANLNSYVVEKGLDGIFYYLAKEEEAIRENPLERTTELLQQVFGSQ